MNHFHTPRLATARAVPPVPGGLKTGGARYLSSTVMEANTANVVRGYIAALNRGNADEIARFVTEDFHNEHTSARGHSLTGRAAYRERLESFLATFANLHYQVEDLIVEGDRAALPYTMTYNWLGNGPPGRRVQIRGMFRFRVVGQEIAHRVDYWDGSEVERQIR
jgi:predicted ester cyclase